MGLIDQSALSQTLPARSSIWAKSIVSTYDTPWWLPQMCPVHQELTMPLVGVIIFSPNETFCKPTKPPWLSLMGWLSVPHKILQGLVFFVSLLQG